MTMKNRRKYGRLTIRTVGIEGSSQLLFQSGALGAVMKVQTEVDPWLDANGGDSFDVPVYVDETGNPAPFEF